MSLGGVSRRGLLQWMFAVSGLSALPAIEACGGNDTAAESGFFTDGERRALAALSNAVFPPDDTPGAADLGVVAFIERTLTAFDAQGIPKIYAGGPYSGRLPFSDGKGNPGTNFPSNDFQNFLPLDRVHTTSWRLRLFGSEGMDGGAPNEALSGAVVGLRKQLKDGLAAAMKQARAPLETLDQAALKDEFDALDKTFRDLIIELVPQAIFSAPEYGGNTNLGGWKIVHFEGDSMPLGYSIFDESTETYKDRPDAPCAGPNPGADPEPMDATTLAFLERVVAALGGKVFS